jgi:hypothetical protein
MMLKLVVVVGILLVTSVGHAQTNSTEKKTVITAEQCSKQCSRLCFAADAFCINKCQTRCLRAGSKQ